MTKNCDNCINSGRPSYEWPCTACTSAYGSAPSKWESHVTDNNVGKWITVSARLPFAEYGESEDVLTVDEWGLMQVLYFDGGCWCYSTGETCPHKITHWMPLPEPPEH